MDSESEPYKLGMQCSGEHEVSLENTTMSQSFESLDECASVGVSFGSANTTPHDSGLYHYRH